VSTVFLFPLYPTMNLAMFTACTTPPLFVRIYLFQSITFEKYWQHPAKTLVSKPGYFGTQCTGILLLE
jgi:hypothetical protein